MLQKRIKSCKREIVLETKEIKEKTKYRCKPNMIKEKQMHAWSMDMIILHGE